MSQLLPSCNPVLFDFDGPICSIFAGSPAPKIAEQLRDLAQRHGADTTAVRSQDDPLEVLRWAGTQPTELLTAVEDALVRAEVAAVAVAVPTPGAHDLIKALRLRGNRIGVASNNSGPAIRTYLAAHDLTEAIDVVAGRRPYEPWTMKPDATCLTECLAQLRTTADRCVFVGDSLTDIQAARALGMPVIGFANSPGKAATFSAAGANAVISNVAELFGQ
jgi:HAD superfamily hydrolase (TIGR01509 family)